MLFIALTYHKIMFAKVDFALLFYVFEISICNKQRLVMLVTESQRKWKFDQSGWQMWKFEFSTLDEILFMICWYYKLYCDAVV